MVAVFSSQTHKLQSLLASSNREGGAERNWCGLRAQERERQSDLVRDLVLSRIQRSSPEKKERRAAHGSFGSLTPPSSHGGSRNDSRNDSRSRSLTPSHQPPPPPQPPSDADILSRSSVAVSFSFIVFSSHTFLSSTAEFIIDKIIRKTTFTVSSFHLANDVDHLSENLCYPSSKLHQYYWCLWV